MKSNTIQSLSPPSPSPSHTYNQYSHIYGSEASEETIKDPQIPRRERDPCKPMLVRGSKSGSGGGGGGSCVGRQPIKDLQGKLLRSN